MTQPKTPIRPKAAAVFLSFLLLPMIYFLLDAACAPLTDRQVHLLTMSALLCARLLWDGVKAATNPADDSNDSSSPPPTHEASGLRKKNDTPSRREEALIRENSALCITIKNMSDEHTLLCELRSTLARQRRDSKESMQAIMTMKHDMLTMSRRSSDDSGKQEQHKGGTSPQPLCDDRSRDGHHLRCGRLTGGSCGNFRTGIKAITCDSPNSSVSVTTTGPCVDKKNTLTRRNSKSEGDLASLVS